MFRLLIILFSWGTVAIASDLNVAGSADFTLPTYFEVKRPENGSDSTYNKLNIRAVDLEVYGPIDHNFEGLLLFSAHDENNEFKAELEEAYVSSSKLIPDSNFRIGKYFLNVGRLNGFHQHDWPFTTTPIVMNRFFGNNEDDMTGKDFEGLNDVGAEYSYLLPLPFYLDVTVGMANGYRFYHDSTENARPRAPTHYIHPVLFFDVGDHGGLQNGLSYLSRTDNLGVRASHWGWDMVYKKRQGKRLVYLLQSEVWYRNRSSLTTSTEEAIGGYIFPEYGLNDTWSVGIRGDLYNVLSKKLPNGNKQKNLEYGITPQVTYRPSEFLLTRLSYTQGAETLQEEQFRREQRVDFQLVYFMGSHPTHDF